MSKQVHVRIPDAKVWADFKAWILYEHRSDYAITGKMLQYALESFMALKGWKEYDKKITLPNNPELLETIDDNTHKKFNKKQEQIILSFDKVFCQDTFITDKRLINFIKKELNVIDFRTVNKWKSFLKTVGLIEKEPREKKWTNIAPMDIMTILNDSIVEVES